MITEPKSVRDIWKKMASEHHGPSSSKKWSGPPAGIVHTAAVCGLLRFAVNLRVRDCINVPSDECRRQFTLTTRMPMHSTKLDLRVWIVAIFLVLTSRKGICSVVMSRILGVNQKTAWELCRPFVN
jgi:hypothetical protein